MLMMSTAAMLCYASLIGQEASCAVIDHDDDHDDDAAGWQEASAAVDTGDGEDQGGEGQAR